MNLKKFFKAEIQFIVHLAARTVSGIKNKKNSIQFKNTYLPIKNLVDN